MIFYLLLYYYSLIPTVPRAGLSSVLIGVSSATTLYSRLSTPEAFEIYKVVSLTLILIESSSLSNSIKWSPPATLVPEVEAK
jgi:hypothetical protein